MKTRTCEICSKSYPARAGLHTCSMECRDERTKRKRAERNEDRTCPCGATFNAPRSIRGLPNPAKFCGVECVGENNRRLRQGRRFVSRETVKCKNPGCEVTFARAIDNGKRRVKEFCGKVCRGQLVYTESGLKDKLISKNFFVTLTTGSKMKVRSRWEAAFIKDYLEPHGFAWQHEEIVIDLLDGRKYIPDFYILDDAVFVEIKGYEWGPSIEKVKIARGMGYSIIYADHKVLTSVFGLDLSSKHLNELVEEMV